MATKKNKIDSADVAVTGVEEDPDAGIQENEDGSVTVDLDGDPKDEVFEYSEDDANLVETFLAHPIGKESLRDLAKRVIDDWDREFEARGEYVERMMSDWKIFTGTLPKKEWPHQYSANPHVPIMIENVTRIAFRIEGELFDDWQNILTVVPMGPEDQAAAAVLTEHNNWQFRTQLSGFQRQQSRGILAFIIHGDVVSHSFYDEIAHMNAHEILLPNEFVIPFHRTSTKPDFSDCPWLAKLLYKHEHELEQMRGAWSEIDTVIGRKDPSWTDDPDSRMAEVISEVHGVELPEDASAGPYKLIWWEGWEKLPNEEHSRFLQIIVDYHTRAVVKLAVHERANWQEKLRYERQLQELDQYRTAQVMHQQQMEQYGALVAQHDDHLLSQADTADAARESGMMPPDQQLLALQALEQASSAPLPPPPDPPMPPEWMQDPENPQAAPEPPRKEPIRLFAHGVCIEPLVGNLGIGYGGIQADFNRAANIALSQFTDSATNNNVKSFIMSNDVKFDGDFRITPGGVKKIRGVSAAELKQAILPLEFGPANQQLVQVVEMMEQYGSQSMQAPTVLSGDPGKSGETAKGITARIEQAVKQLTVVARKYLMFFQQQTMNNALLNSIFLPEDEIVEITNHIARVVEPLRINRSLYERNYAVEFKADLRFASQAQRIQEADEMTGMTLQDPMLQQIPKMHVYALRKSFEARGRQDMMQMLDDWWKQKQEADQAAQQAAQAAQAAGVPPPGPPGAPPPGAPPHAGPGGPSGPGMPPQQHPPGPPGLPQ